jgi:hypothetical protein
MSWRKFCTALPPAFTIAPGIVNAARPRPALVGWAFVGPTVGALLWIFTGYLDRAAIVSACDDLGLFF